MGVHGVDSSVQLGKAGDVGGVSPSSPVTNALVPQKTPNDTDPDLSILRETTVVRTFTSKTDAEDFLDYLQHNGICNAKVSVGQEQGQDKFIIEYHA